MVIFLSKIQVGLNHYKELVQTLFELAEDFRKEQGCSGCHIYKDMEAEKDIVLAAQWETKRDLNRYLKSKSFEVLVGALKVLSMSFEITWLLESGQQRS